MANYDEQVLGTGNINHPANERDLTDREMLTEVYDVPTGVLEIFDNLEDLISYQYSQIKKYKTLLNEVKETLSASNNGMCIIVRNQIENFLNK